MPRIIDCFTFYNELDLLEYRLDILNDVVDFFVLVEATKTHVGYDKDLYFENNKSRFDKYLHKIVHTVDNELKSNDELDMQKGEQWQNENRQRNSINVGISMLNNNIQLNDDDIIIISDLDEIPNPKTLYALKTEKFDIDYIPLELDLYYYDIQHRISTNWYASIIVKYKKYITHPVPQDYRNHLNIQPYFIKNAGWHLSYFGSTDFIKNKIQNYTHQENNIPQFTNSDHINDCIQNNKDLFNRNILMEFIPINQNTNLPPLIQNYKLFEI